jgi:hypothetical protein
MPNMSSGFALTLATWVAFGCCDLLVWESAALDATTRTRVVPFAAPVFAVLADIIFRASEEVSCVFADLFCAANTSTSSKS